MENDSFCWICFSIVTSASESPPISMTEVSSRVTAQAAMIPTGTCELIVCQPPDVKTSTVEMYPEAKTLTYFNIPWITIQENTWNATN